LMAYYAETGRSHPPDRPTFKDNSTTQCKLIWKSNCLPIISTPY
jgi:hypothetical protein